MAARVDWPAEATTSSEGGTPEGPFRTGKGRVDQPEIIREANLSDVCGLPTGHGRPTVAHLTVNETAEYLGTTERHVRELIYKRQIPYIKIGRLVRFDRGELQQWLDANRVPMRRAS